VARRCLIVLLLLGAALDSPVAAAAAPPPAPVIQAARGPQLIAFDGLSELAGVSARLGMLAQRLDYTIEVGPDGAPTGCTLARKFRSPLVSKQLCEVLMRRSRFEPARDAWGTALGGRYTGSIRFDMPIKPDR
jgi:protein TonB